MITESLSRLVNYIESENYRGYDPYDMLKSPFFKLPILKSNKTIRFYSQQIGKRLPLNIRSLLFIPKGYNPVTLGLCIQGYSYLYQCDNNKEKKENYLSRIYFLIDELEKLVPINYSGACWGYDFPWTAKYADIPSYQPTIVATGIITNALFECFKITHLNKAFELCKSATEFLLKDVNQSLDGDKICFSYSPFDKQKVLNANMKGVRMLSQVYSISKDEVLLNHAKKAVDFVMQHQDENGSWPYSLASKGGWVDNYHTGYVLDCLHEYINCTGEKLYIDNLKKGYDYYLKNFFEEGIIPKFYDKNRYPLDCTAAAQSILTLCRFGDVEKARQIGEYTIDNMQHKKGYFYFRKYKMYSQKTSFMRWSNAWMMTSLSLWLLNDKLA